MSVSSESELEPVLNPEEIAVYNEFMFPPIEDDRTILKTMGSLVIYQEKCGSGAYGVVHEGKLLKDGKVVDVAVKVEKKEKHRNRARYEINFYQEANTWINNRIPKMLHCLDNEDEGVVIVMERLDWSLKKLCVSSFSFKTILMIADQVIPILESLHDKGYIHRDIKPHNLMVKSRTKIYLIDFGHAEKYLDENGKHKTEEHPCELVGTARYMSIHTHTGLQQSRKDDLLAFMHVLMYLYRGFLPWQGNNKCLSTLQNTVEIGVRKELMIDDALSEMDPEFERIYRSLLDLRFDERPNYQDIRDAFAVLSANLGYYHDNNFDWLLGGFYDSPNPFFRNH